MDISTLRTQHSDHWRMACAVRVLALDAVANARSGHSGLPMGMADVATVLFRNHFISDPNQPTWPNRDRFVLSAGHGSMLLYALLYLTGAKDMPLDTIKAFRSLHAATAGHPEYGAAGGIETTTGPLGQGLANAVGMAIAEASLRARLQTGVIDHHTYVIAGDGCLMEGISQEAITLAGKQALSRLIVLWDNNGITIDGNVALADCTDQAARFKASGWLVLECDGHNPNDIDRALVQAKQSVSAPVLIACRTHIALGSSAQDTATGHGALTDPRVIAETKAAYGWATEPAFFVPKDVLDRWRHVGARGATARAAWEKHIHTLPRAQQQEIQRVLAVSPAPLSAQAKSALSAYKQQTAIAQPAVATRQASGQVLSVLTPLLPTIIGGSADLSSSNNTRTKSQSVFSPENRAGQYICYGIREHAMAAVLSGLVLHGGVRAYGGTFLCFSDYARPAMRLAALMGLPVVYVMTHDSIGVGEDGPTHQPVEHIAALRAIPNLLVLRPADAVETAEAWDIALQQTNRPSVLCLSRQSVPTLRVLATCQTKHTAKGAYILADADADVDTEVKVKTKAKTKAGKRHVILLATGSEVHLAIAARKALQAEGIGTRVVSMPCWELFAEQSEAYQNRVLPRGAVRVAIEAAVPMGWEQWLYGHGGRAQRAAFVGMQGFGASAPAGVLYNHFGITAERVVAEAKRLLHLRS